MKLLVGAKMGTAASGNHGHAGRPGKVGGSAPRSHTTVQAKYSKPEDLPTVQKWGYDNVVDPNVYLYYQGNEDIYLKAILHDQGFDGLPDALSEEEMDAHIAESGETVIYRGIHANKPETAEAWGKQFVDGELFVGKGTYGDGTYFGSDPDEAAMYAGRRGIKDGTGYMERATLKKDAKVIEMTDLEHLIAKQRIAAQANQKTAIHTMDLATITPEQYADKMDRLNIYTHGPIYNDYGRYAASHGYDAIRVGMGGDAAYYVILNRTALRVQATNYASRYQAELDKLNRLDIV